MTKDGVQRDGRSLVDGPRRSPARRWPNSPTATAASWSASARIRPDTDCARPRSVLPEPCSTSPKATTRRSKVCWPKLRTLISDVYIFNLIMISLLRKVNKAIKTYNKQLSPSYRIFIICPLDDEVVTHSKSQILESGSID